jgi:hypothetical protein
MSPRAERLRDMKTFASEPLPHSRRVACVQCGARFLTYGVGAMHHTERACTTARPWASELRAGRVRVESYALQTLVLGLGLPHAWWTRAFSEPWAMEIRLLFIPEGLARILGSRYTVAVRVHTALDVEGISEGWVRVAEMSGAEFSALLGARVADLAAYPDVRARGEARVSEARAAYRAQAAGLPVPAPLSLEAALVQGVIQSIREM